MINQDIVEKLSVGLPLNTDEVNKFLNILNRSEQNTAELDKLFDRSVSNGATDDLRVYAGAFVSKASGQDPWIENTDFTGNAQLLTPLTVSGTAYTIIGMNAGVLKFGLSYVDGTITAVDGKFSGQITAGGVDIKGPLTITGTNGSFAMGITPPTANNSGTGIWGTGTDGWLALTAGVVQSSFTSSGVSWGAGNLVGDATALTIKSNTYPGAAYIQWKSADTSVVTGQLISDYAGVAVNTGLRAIGQAHDSGVRGYSALFANDHNGVNKANLVVDSNGTSTFDHTAVVGAVGANSLLVKTKTSSTNALNTMLGLYTDSSGTPAAGLGGALAFFAKNSAGVLAQIGYAGARYTTTTSGAEVSLLTFGVMAGGVVTGKLATDVDISTTGLLSVTGVATFLSNPVITNASPSLIFTDTTGSAKSLTIKVDGNFAQIRESAGADGSLLVLDLTNNRVGIGVGSPAFTLDVAGTLNVTGSASFSYPITSAPIQTTAATYSVTTTDFSIVCNRGAGVTITLPTASSFPNRWLHIKTAQASAIISASSNVSPQVAVLGGAAGTAILPATDGAWAFLVSDGTTWNIMMQGV